MKPGDLSKKLKASKNEEFLAAKQQVIKPQGKMNGRLLVVVQFVPKFFYFTSQIIQASFRKNMAKLLLKKESSN